MTEAKHEVKKSLYKEQRKVIDVRCYIQAAET